MVTAASGIDLRIEWWLYREKSALALMQQGCVSYVHIDAVEAAREISTRWCSSGWDGNFCLIMQLK